MNNESIELMARLRDMDPDEVVDFLGVDTDTLVDALVDVIDEYVADRGLGEEWV